MSGKFIGAAGVNPRYANEQDDDPRTGTDRATSPASASVNAAEFQVFSS